MFINTVGLCQLCFYWRGSVYKEGVEHVFVLRWETRKLHDSTTLML